MEQKYSTSGIRSLANTHKADTIDGMALATLLALPFLIYYLWGQHVPPTYRITMTHEACKALASAGLPTTPDGESCTATLPIELNNPLEKFPTIYFRKDGALQKLMVSPDLIISAKPLND